MAALPAPTLTVKPDVDTLAADAAHHIVEAIAHAQTTGGVHGDHIARVVLTGGTAGIATLRALGDLHEQQNAATDRVVDYSRVHFFFGDERAVPVDHPDSNEGQAREALLGRINVPEANIHSYRLGELTPQESAAHMTEVLDTIAPKGFDLHLLGMGGEGHINSLFPHTAALAAEGLVTVEDNSPKPPSSRVTLTMGAVNRAEKVWFLIAGADKQEATHELLHRGDPQQWPAAGAHGTQATHVWATRDALSPQDLPSA